MHKIPVVVAYNHIMQEPEDEKRIKMSAVVKACSKMPYSGKYNFYYEF